MAPQLIYCASGNRRFAEIAINAGFLYGAQVPATVYFPPFFCDQDWKKPDREKYMMALKEHRPHIASVLDLEQESQLQEVLEWAEEAAQYVQVIMIIPKVFGIIPGIPEKIGGKPVRLGYSVPTKFGGTELPVWEFGRREVHLLGGSPHRQMELYRYLNVQSADGNYFGLKARKWCEHWQWPNKWIPDGGKTGYDAIYKAFSLSCQNIMQAWQRVFNE